MRRFGLSSAFFFGVFGRVARVLTGNFGVPQICAGGSTWNSDAYSVSVASY